jgi:hypothetical protein
MANGKAEDETLTIELIPEQICPNLSGESVLYVEGAEPVAIYPIRRDGKLSTEVSVPAYGAAVWTIAYESNGQTK